MLAGKTILVGATGGIAAHYLPELVGQLRLRHLSLVQVMMTPAATRFVSPLTLAVAAGGKVWADASYGVVVAFDALGHSSSPECILAEMFRVCTANGVVLIAEYNRRGRQATRHLNFGFETRLAKMLRRYCSPCQRIEQPYHTTFVCRK